MSKHLDALEFFLKNARKLEMCGGLPDDEDEFEEGEAEEEESEGFRKFVIKLVTGEWFLAGHFEPALFDDFWEITFLDERCQEDDDMSPLKYSLCLDEQFQFTPSFERKNIILIDPKKISWIYPF